jgi:sugar lactone lactonase YvrE
MYFVESRKRRVDLFDYNVETGELTRQQEWLSIPDDFGYPDGLTVDAEGCVWLALYLSGRVHRYDPDGVFMEALSFPVRKVTSVGFGGERLTDLYVTSARFGLSPSELEAEPLAGATFVVSGAGHGQRTVAWDSTTLVQ